VVKTSVVMTVFDRPIEVILRTLRGLWECDLTDTQIVVVNDGSTFQYRSVRNYVESEFPSSVWFDMPDYPAFRMEDGGNNPAKAFNQAVSLAEGENLIVMSSDVLVPPATMARAKKQDFSKAVWTPFVEDTYGSLSIGREYCGPGRLFPMPWFLGMSKSHLIEVGGWDEGYLEGLCFEDNDVVGRVCLRTGRFVGDWSVKVYHQGHVQPAYAVEKETIFEANSRNRQYTMAKWGGIPFEAEYTPFDVSFKMQRSGDAAHECVDKAGKLEAAIAKTKGMYARVS